MNNPLNFFSTTNWSELQLTLWSKVGNFTRIAVLCLTLSTFATACTENEDDIECGTTEFPCDDGNDVVIDDMLEI